MSPPATTAMNVRTVNGAELTSSRSYQLAQALPRDSQCEYARITLSNRPTKPATLTKLLPNIQAQAKPNPITENRTGGFTNVPNTPTVPVTAGASSSSKTSMVPLTGWAPRIVFQTL